MNFRVSTYVDRPPSTVFSVVIDLERLPQWEESFTEVTAETSGPVRVGSRYWCKRKIPRVAESRIVVSELELDRRVMIEGDWIGFLKPVFGFELEPEGRGTRLTLVTRSEVRVLEPLMGLYGRRVSPKYLMALKGYEQVHSCSAESTELFVTHIGAAQPSRRSVPQLIATLAWLPGRLASSFYPRRTSRPRPASLARITACARSATWSLLKMLDTWLRTVFKLSTKCWAISSLVRPGQSATALPSPARSAPGTHAVEPRDAARKGNR